MTDKCEFTYGEVLFQYFTPLFALTKPKEGEVFWDIGCGAGRPLAIASMNFPMLGRCCGVELLDGLHNLAKSNAKSLLSHTSTYPDLVPIEIYQGDMLELEWWSQADIVYASSVCFPDSLVDGIVDKCALLKPGSRVITLKKFRVVDYLRLDYALQLKMTWGKCQVIIYTKL